jgi:phosphoglycerate dehydrogenase-like enzyme
MTPHSSGLTRQTFAARVGDIAANVRRLAAGEPLLNVVAVSDGAGQPAGTR